MKKYNTRLIDTAELLLEISGIVGHDGEDPSELVEAVRAFEDRRPIGVPDCAECDAAEALLEIAELVGKRGASSGLVVEAVRESVETAATLSATGDLLRGDLLRACGMDKTHRDLTTDWPLVSLVATQTIANLEHRRDSLLAELTQERAVSANLHNEIARLNGQTHSESEQVTALRGELSVVRAELLLVEQAHDEWEQRAVQAEMNVETLEAELKDAETRNGKLQCQLAGYAPEPCASTTHLLDIALRALRGEGPDADQLATLIDAARRAA